jgi:hypothetical protein
MRRLVLLGTATLLVALSLALAACTTTTSTDTTDTTSALPQDLLHDPGRAGHAMVAIERAVGAAPAQATDVDVYPEYLDVKAQDPTNAEHIDEYEWRDGAVGPPTPVQLSGPQEEVDASLFPTSVVDWKRLPALVRAAEQAALHNTPLRIEQPQAQYVLTERSTSSDDDGRVLIRIYINGPRRSGYVEMAANGDIRTVNVS